MSVLYDNFFRLDIMAKYWTFLIEGLVVTAELAAATILAGLALGVVLSLVRILGIRPLNLFLIVFVDIFRVLPPLVVIMIIYFGLQPVGIAVSGFVAVWLGLMLKLAAYTEEIVYAAMLSISPGQMEAARSTGLSFAQGLLNIVLPQALRKSIAPLTNRTITITKNTALGSVVAVQEVLGSALNVQSMVYNTTPLTMALIAYVIIFLPLVVMSRMIEQRYGRRA